MRRYKLAVHALVLFSVFNFVPALAAPIPVREVREARADVADRAEDVIIVMGKRAAKEEDSWSWSTQASPRSGSESDYLSTSRGSTPTSDDTSEIHHYTRDSIQLVSPASDVIGSPPPASGGTEQPYTTSKTPPASSVRTRPVKWVPTTGFEPDPEEMQSSSYAKGGTELPWHSSQPGTTSRIPLAGSVRTKTNKMAPTTKIIPPPSGEMGTPLYASGGTKLPWYSAGRSKSPPASSVRTKPIKWVPTTGFEPDPEEMQSSRYAKGGTELPWHSPQPGTTNKIPPAGSVRTKTNKLVPTTNSRPEMGRPPYESGGTELPWYSAGKAEPPQSKSFFGALISKLKLRPRMSPMASDVMNTA